MSAPTTDRRLTLIRDGLADVRLEGLVAAERFAAVVPMQVATPTASLRKAASAEAEQENQLLFGERFDVLFEDDGFAFGQARRDGYVGYVPTDTLSLLAEAPTHRVAAIRTYAFSQPDIKSAIVGLYSIDALVTVQARDGRFVKAAGSGWITEAHLGAIGTGETDYVAVAERFLGAPYQWGGRESLGLDCSALVQLSLAACNRACPRDTDLQRGFFAEIDMAERRRGDLVFWKGHVAVLLDADTILHANAHHMAVAIESLAEAITRIEAAGVGSPLGYRRV
jgi:cell wall-associated NlpC family hydrolase